MIADIFFLIITLLLNMLNAILPPYGGVSFSLYPTAWTDAITFFFLNFMKLNGLFPVDHVLADLSIFSVVLFWLLIAKLANSIFGYIRGTSNPIS